MKMNIPEPVLSIYHYLINHHYEAYFVGGCVRDGLMGIECSDYDITTNALVPEMIELFTPSPFKLILTGAKHGTITVINQSIPVEITTYRMNEVYDNHRIPTVLTFATSLSEDLKRRDFTINALAYDLNTITDEHHGIQDIHDKIIRCINNPFVRFNEDALRILRAIRFAHRYQFTIEEKTKEACLALFPLLKMISIERVRDEFFKMLLDKQPHLIESLHQYPFFSTFIPELTKPCNLDNVPSRLDFKLAHLLNETDSTNILKRFKCDNNLIKQVEKLIKYQHRCFHLERIQLRTFTHEVNDDVKFVEDLLLYTKQSDVLKYFQCMIHENDLYTIHDLAINGNDCIDLGLIGKAISQALESCLMYVIHEPSRNNKEELIKHINNK